MLCFSLGSRLRGNDVGVRGNDGGCEGEGGGGKDVRFHPHPRFKPGAGSSPLPSRERGLMRGVYSRHLGSWRW